MHYNPQDYTVKPDEVFMKLNLKEKSGKEVGDALIADARLSQRGKILYSNSRCPKIFFCIDLGTSEEQLMKV
jgi:hypothetical protein